MAAGEEIRCIRRGMAAGEEIRCIRRGMATGEEIRCIRRGMTAGVATSKVDLPTRVSTLFKYNRRRAPPGPPITAGENPPLTQEGNNLESKDEHSF